MLRFVCVCVFSLSLFGSVEAPDLPLLLCLSFFVCGVYCSQAAFWFDEAHGSVLPDLYIYKYIYILYSFIVFLFHYSFLNGNAHATKALWVCARVCVCLISTSRVHLKRGEKKKDIYWEELSHALCAHRSDWSFFLFVCFFFSYLFCVCVCVLYFFFWSSSIKMEESGVPTVGVFVLLLLFTLPRKRRWRPRSLLLRQSLEPPSEHRRIWSTRRQQATMPCSCALPQPLSLLAW